MRIKWSTSNEIFRVSSGAGDDDDDDDNTVRFDVVVFAFGRVSFVQLSYLVLRTLKNTLPYDGIVLQYYLFVVKNKNLNS